MGKRVLVSDEFELRSLRIRFLAVSGQITAHLAGLVERIGDAPPGAQASLLVLAGQIAAAQQRLRDEIHRLAAHPAECAAMLRITLQAQSAVSSQLADILAADQALSHLGTKLANIAQELASVPRTEPGPIGGPIFEGPTEQGERSDLSIAGANMGAPSDGDTWPGYAMASLAPSEDEDHP